MTKKAGKKSGAPLRQAARRRDDREAIHCIYLYYAKFAQDRDLEQLTAHYFLSGAQPIANATSQINCLIEKIAPKPRYHESCFGDNFMDMRRRRVSYFVVVVEDARGRKLHARRGLQFEDKIVNDEEPDGRGVHTFDTFSYREFTATVEGGQSKALQVATCTNRLRSKRHRGDKLHEREQELFELRLNFAGERRRAKGRKGAIRGDYDESFGFDSGGTNMGPPVPPPV